MKNSFSFSVLTFNIWGLHHWISKDKEARVSAIADALVRENSKYDVICLQEVWIENDFKFLNSALNSYYKYAHYFYSGVLGSGLCIFSKWPILETLYHQWPLNGYIHMIHHGDWFGGKGVGLAVLKVNGFKVNIYTTHLHAQYDMDFDPYLVHRVEQAFDTALFIKMTSGSANFSVLAGDLNTTPGGLCERLIQYTAQFHDAYSVHSEESSIGTNECLRNSYSDPYLVKNNPSGYRIDYILYRGGPTIQANVLSYGFPLEDRVPGKTFSYSDHEAVSAVFQLTESEERSCPSYDRLNFEKSLREGIHVCQSALSQLSRNSWFYWITAISLFLAIIMTPIFLEFPILHSTLYYILLVVTVIFMVYFVLMATLWCKVEHNGILGVKQRMALMLQALLDNKQ